MGSAPRLASVDANIETCSAKGCQQAAVWALEWNNPKLHTPERRKTWLACPEHKDHLSQFLGARGFLRDVLPHPSESAEVEGD